MNNKKIFISLIVPTLGRTKELDYLIASIIANKYKKLELIIVDQNQDNRLDNIVEKYKNTLKINHLKVNFKGASRARNYGVKFANGDIINFPDDDSIMCKDTLNFVNCIFINKKHNFDAISGKVSDEESSSDILKFLKKKSIVTKYNMYNTTIEFNFYIKRRIFLLENGFDENLGIGEYFGAEESADFIMRLLYKEKRIFYYPKIFSFHPNKKNYSDFNKSYSYALGFGGYAKKHLFVYGKLTPLFQLLYRNFKNVLAILYSILFKDYKRLKYYTCAFKGRIKGFIEWKIY